MTADTCDVLVVGGGVVGCAVAYYVAQRGMEARLIEAGDIPSATSRASLGLLTHPNGLDSPLSRLYRDGHAAFGHMAEELRAEVGMDVGWTTPGGMDVVLSPAEEVQARELLRFNHERGCPAEWLDVESLRWAEPHIAREAVAAIFFPDDHRVDPSRLSAALVAAMKRRGGSIAVQTSLVGLAFEGQGGISAKTSTGNIFADFVVLTGGAWTAALAQFCGSVVPVRPVRGQHARYRGGGRLRHILRHGGHYLVGVGDDVLVVSTVEETNFVVETTCAAGHCFDDVFARVLHLVPDRLGLRAGLRPKPKGGRPLIGPLTRTPRIFVATGHYKNGILLALVTGQIVGDWIADGRPNRDMAFFSPER